MSGITVRWKIGCTSFLMAIFSLLLAAVFDLTGFHNLANYAGFTGLALFGIALLTLIVSIWVWKD